MRWLSCRPRPGRAPTRRHARSSRRRGSRAALAPAPVRTGSPRSARPSARPPRTAPAGRARRSFQALPDPVALNVQPQRLDIVTLDRRTTIDALARLRPSPASAAMLALINQVELQTPLEAGRLMKWVVGQPLPYTDSSMHQTSKTQR